MFNSEPSESEISQINKFFPNRSASEVRQAIVQARELFHGSRGNTRNEILSRLLSDPA